MTSVGIPASADSDANVKLSRDIIRIFSSDDQLQSFSKENMEQIRHTMMQHEQLFKEQVEALHKLYNIQISAMQDIRKLIYCPAKLLASSSDTIEVDDDQCHSSVVEEKSLKPVYVAAEAYLDQSSVLAVHPILAVKEFTGCSPEKPFWLDNREVKPSSTRKDLRREIDLERPPEEYIDETDYPVEANNYGVPDSDSSMSKESPERNCFFYKESKLSLNQPAEQPLWFLQVSQPFTSRTLNCTHTAEFFKSETRQLEKKDPEQAKESNLSLSNTYLSSSTEPASEQFQQYQALEGTDMIRVSEMTLNKQSQDFGQFVPSHGDSALLDTKSIDNISSQKHNNCNCVLRCQTGEDDRNENPNFSGHGSNSPVSQGGKVCRDGDLSTMAVKNKTDCIDCEQPIGHLEVLSKPEETPQLTKSDDIKPLSSISHSEIDQREQENCDNSWQHQNAAAKSISNCHGTVKNEDDVVDKKGSQDDFNSESKLEEACESIAAKILLSFAPCRSRTDTKWQSSRTWIDAESSQSSRDSTSHGKKQIKHVRRSLNYSNDSSIDEAVKWTKSVRGRRRRTSRRQR